MRAHVSEASAQATFVTEDGLAINITISVHDTQGSADAAAGEILQAIEDIVEDHDDTPEVNHNLHVMTVDDFIRSLRLGATGVVNDFDEEF